MSPWCIGCINAELFLHKTRHLGALGHLLRIKWKLETCFFSLRTLVRQQEMRPTKSVLWPSSAQPHCCPQDTRDPSVCICTLFHPTPPPFGRTSACVCSNSAQNTTKSQHFLCSWSSWDVPRPNLFKGKLDQMATVQVLNQKSLAGSSAPAGWRSTSPASFEN